MEQKFTGKEKFTIEFTSEEWGLMTMGIRCLVGQMRLAASAVPKTKEKYEEVLKKSSAIVDKIATTMNIDI